jgi:hypothetical protein
MTPKTAIHWPATRWPVMRRVAGLVWAWMLLASLVSGADLVIDEGFDDPEPTWYVRPATGVRAIAQLRTRSPDPTNPTTTERIVMACPAGYAAHVAHEVGQLPVIDEQVIEVVVRGNRQAIQLAAEVVYPRSIDPKTGKPVRTLVQGHRYSNPGGWQKLSLEKLPLLAGRHARLMSTDPKEKIDPHEAYVENVVLVVPGGTDQSMIEIDQMTIMGVTTDKPAVEGPALSFGGDSEGPLLQAPGAAPAKKGESFQPIIVRRHGNTLTVENQPLVPRMIEYRGEPMELIAELGFNAVWFTEPVTEAQLQGARAAKLWVVCPPPPVDVLAKIEVDSVWQTVLAWSLGSERDGLSLDSIASQSEQLRRIDPLNRPLLVGARDQHRRYGQLADLLVRSAALDLDAQQARMPLPVMGCSPWTQLSLGWTPEARKQAQLIAPRASHLGWYEPLEIRRAVLNALATGTRGLAIRTPERLGSASPEAMQLADQLRLLNDELRLVEPWLVSGKRTASTPVEGTGVETMAWQLGRSRLVYVPEQPISIATLPPTSSIVVTGLPETTRAHLLTPAGLLPLAGQRAAGGYLVQLPSIAAGGWLLLTDDTRTLAQVQQRIGRNAMRAAQSERSLALAEVLELETVENQLASPRDNIGASRVAPLKQAIQQCDQMLASQQATRTLQYAAEIRHAAAIERRRVETQQMFSGFVSLPTDRELRLLPTQRALEQSLAVLPRGDNLLQGGDFEDLASTKNAGWLHANYAEARLDTGVQFTNSQPYHGGASLRLTARDLGDAAELDEDPKPVVWITSPPVEVRESGVIEVTGWVRVATTDAAAGQLMVVDSLGGEQAALRIATTTGWQPFRMVRTVDETRSLQINFALTGPAVAEVDAVMIREVLGPNRTARQVAEPPK